MQKSKIKDIVHTFDFPSQLQLVFNMSNTTQDLKWSNKLLDNSE